MSPTGKGRKLRFSFHLSGIYLRLHSRPVCWVMVGRGPPHSLCIRVAMTASPQGHPGSNPGCFQVKNQRAAPNSAVSWAQYQHLQPPYVVLGPWGDRGLEFEFKLQGELPLARSNCLRGWGLGRRFSRESVCCEDLSLDPPERAVCASVCPCNHVPGRPRQAVPEAC